MNCTHQLTFTPERQKQLMQTYKNNPKIRRALMGEPDIQNNILKPEDVDPSQRGLLNGPAHLDREKFNIDSVMHFIHCALYVLHPEEYQTECGTVNVRTHQGELNSENMWDSDQGQTDFTPNPESRLKVATKILNPSNLFNVFEKSLQAILPPQRLQGRAV